jgi:hypothetical protein
MLSPSSRVPIVLSLVLRLLLPSPAAAFSEAGLLLDGSAS